MLDILKFIFSSFWIWLGTVVLIITICSPIVQAIAAAKKKAGE